MSYVCNPMNIPYKYQFVDEQGVLKLYREAADPSMVYFNDKYFIFPSMAAGFLWSENLVEWEYQSLEGLPINDYAPDVRVIGDYLYFSASSFSHNCSFYRTKDPIQGTFEEIEGSFPFWDPNLFVDDDGKVYFYWGCSNVTPIWGAEINPVDMKLKMEPVELIHSNITIHGYERNGEDHITPPVNAEQIEQMVQATASRMGNTSEEFLDRLRKVFGNDPYIEGAWMDKHNGKYYLQYASPATQYNTYSDAVYVSDHPLGPFTLANNNPYSYKPAGFITGAGHGSTMQDTFGNVWHASSMRVSVNHKFERRLGLWLAGYDQDGELFCNQRYGDWPFKIEQAVIDPWRNPEWMLLSYGKPATASSFVEGREASNVSNEDVRSWWKAASSQPGEWVELDLSREYDVYAVQLNFADDELDVPLPAGAVLEEKRYIEQREHATRWLLEGSLDGEHYFTIEDKRNAATDLPHDFIVREEGLKVRYLRCTITELPYNQAACISGIRVFGVGNGELPGKVTGVKTKLETELDLYVSWNQADVIGYNVLWGFAPDKLYHSYMVYGSTNCEAKIGALIKDQSLYVRVDAFNEAGITEGDVYKVIG